MSRTVMSAGVALSALLSACTTAIPAFDPQTELRYFAARSARNCGAAPATVLAVATGSPQRDVHTGAPSVPPADGSENGTSAQSASSARAGGPSTRGCSGNGGCPQGARAQAEGVARGEQGAIQCNLRQLVVTPSGETIEGGAIEVVGAEQAQGLALVEGDLEARPAGPSRGMSAEWNVSGGHVVLASDDGRRWRAEVTGGTLRARREERASRGRWRSAGGTLRVRATPEPPAGRAVASSDPQPPPAAPARRRRAMSTRERRALTGLLRTVPANSREAARLSRAAQFVDESLVDGGPMFYNIPIVGRSLTVLVDVSYSMSEPDPHAAGSAEGPSKLDMVRAQLAVLLASLPPEVAVNVIAFSSTTNALFPAPRTLDDVALDQAVRWIGSLRPMDETRPLEALRLAEASRPEQVILLTDGRPTYADSEEPALLTLASQLVVRGARLDVVGIGPDQNAAYLDTLASRGHGIAVHL